MLLLYIYKYIYKPCLKEKMKLFMKDASKDTLATDEPSAGLNPGLSPLPRSATFPPRVHVFFAAGLMEFQTERSLGVGRINCLFIEASERGVVENVLLLQCGGRLADPFLRPP